LGVDREEQASIDIYTKIKSASYNWFMGQMASIKNDRKFFLFSTHTAHYQLNDAIRMNLIAFSLNTFLT
jgi:hypothetical protein